MVAQAAVSIAGVADQERIDRIVAAVRAIPEGFVRTYGDIAKAIGSSARAVGGACGANPVPLVVPCHRVVANDGSLGGFMGVRGEGFERSIKRWLLEHEGALRP